MKLGCMEDIVYLSIFALVDKYSYYVELDQ